MGSQCADLNFFNTAISPAFFFTFMPTDSCQSEANWNRVRSVRDGTSCYFARGFFNSTMSSVKKKKKKKKRLVAATQNHGIRHLSWLSMDKTVNTLNTADALGDTGVCNDCACVCVREKVRQKRSGMLQMQWQIVSTVMYCVWRRACISSADRPELVHSDDARLYMCVSVCVICWKRCLYPAMENKTHPMKSKHSPSHSPERLHWSITEVSELNERPGATQASCSFPLQDGRFKLRSEVRFIFTMTKNSNSSQCLSGCHDTVTWPTANRPQEVTLAGVEPFKHLYLF